jgi:hypothetical protein
MKWVGGFLTKKNGLSSISRLSSILVVLSQSKEEVVYIFGEFIISCVVTVERRSSLHHLNVKC